MKRLRKVLGLALSASLCVGAPGLAPYEALAQVVGRAAPVRAPAVPGAAGQAPILGLAPVTGLAPVAPALSLSVPFAAPAAPSPALALPAPALPSAPASAARAAPAAAPAGAAFAQPAALRAEAAAVAAQPALALIAPYGAATARAAFASLESAGREFAAARPGAAPLPDAAAAAFFDGSAPRPARANAVAPDAESAPKPARRGGLGLALKRAAAAGAVVLGLRMAAPQIPGLPADPGFWTRALDAVGRAGYWVGNVLAFAFALPQIYKTFKDGGAGKTPVWRAVVGASASLALGLVSAPLAKQMFWGVQNVFGGLALAAPMLIGAYLARRGLKFSARKAAVLTAVTAALLFFPSFAMYAAAAELVPDSLGGALGAVGVGHLALGLQIATGAAFFLLFVPDVVAILKGRAPKGFTSMFSMLFALASAGFIAWTLQMAAAAPAGSSERAQFLIYAAQNAAYALVSGLSWLFIRREERKAPR